MALTNITGDRLPTYSFRNRIFNGDMKIDQRKAGAAVVVTTAGAYTADMWKIFPTGNSVNVQRVANTSFPSGYALLVQGNTAITKCAVAIRLEANNNLDLIGANVTLSAIMSSTTVTSVTWGLQSPTAADNYTGSTNNVTGVWTINSTPTRYTSTFVANAACGNGICIFFDYGAFTSGNSYISDVQLEAGSVATPFERLPPAVQLQSCQRYFQKSYAQGTAVATSYANGAGTIEFTVQGVGQGGGQSLTLPVIMRAAGTLTVYDHTATSAKVDVWTGAAYVGGGAVSTTKVSDSAIYIQTSNVCPSFIYDYALDASIS